MNLGSLIYRMGQLQFHRIIKKNMYIYMQNTYHVSENMFIVVIMLTLCIPEALIKII